MMDIILMSGTGKHLSSDFVKASFRSFVLHKELRALLGVWHVSLH